jgi:phospholipid transport system substrate-binding protein
MSLTPPRFALIMTALIMIVGAAPAGPAPVQGATEAIRRANDRLRELLAQPADDSMTRDKISEQVTGELRGLLDVGFLTERALVDHWAKMTPKQRTQVQSTLRAIIEKNYLNHLRGNLDYTTEYSGEDKQANDVLVKTIIRAKKNGRPTRIPVDYKLRLEADHWRVFDVITYEESILTTWRQQFNKIIAKDGVDGLISRMKTKLEKSEKPAKAGEPASQQSGVENTSR